MNRSVTLEDKFDISERHVFLSGTQALVRLCLLQSERDHQAGLQTAGYVTGYRGSPLGGLDQQFPRAKSVLDRQHIVFEPALNEDLAATAIWGAQQAELRGEGAHDGVFCIWYGKGPGVDRSGDALRHGNLAGSSKHGGVLVIMGDDHTCESSTTAHQSEFALKDAMMPVLNPANVKEIIEYGLYGWALSRFSGLWVGLKCVKDNVESSASIESGIDSVDIEFPTDVALPIDGLNIRTNDTPLDQEARLHRYKLKAAQAFVKYNRLDRMVWSGGERRRIGIVSTGKSWMDTLQALEELGISEDDQHRLGLSLFKVAMPWPLEPDAVSEFCLGLDLVIVVEEKRALIEDQLKVLLYPQETRPTIIGKCDETGQVLLPSEAALNPVQIAQVIGLRLAQHYPSEYPIERLAAINELLNAERLELDVQRKPWFCAGCPHNSSTVVPSNTRAYAGIGCHYMVQFMDRRTEGYTHMGGEGANWVGESKFSTRKHIFQNIGDGTYNHSGLMAIRAAIASGTTITFKLLYNDAVALTGGQTHDGGIDVYRILHEVHGLGVTRLDLVSDTPDQHRSANLPPDTLVSHRDQLDTIQRQFSEIDGVSVIVYEQTCAAEKRRRRKRGTMVDPAVRVVINEAVCEGCGDCGIQSNCVAIAPLATEFGRKRTIDQSACNKDLSCLKGFCPSLVTVRGGELRKAASKELQIPDLTMPKMRATLDRPYAILLTGVGGTGVVTIGAIIGMAAHIDGIGCGLIDMAGLAQKGGAVVSHVKLSARPSEIQSIRVAAGGADLLLGCDLLVSNQKSVIQSLSSDRSHAIVNTNQMMPPEFTRNPDLELPVNLMHKRLVDAISSDRLSTVDATRLATKLMGDSIGANLFMLGVAWQKGLVPLSLEAFMQAIELNQVAVDFNKRAFDLGRTWVLDPGLVERAVGDLVTMTFHPSSAPAYQLQDEIDKRSRYLTQYQNKRYSRRYRTLVEMVRSNDPDQSQKLTRAVVENYFKLMAFKDEYEVARLFTNGSFDQKIAEQFAGDYRVEYHLAPPSLGWFTSKRNGESSIPKKKRMGPWMRRLFVLLAKFKFLRGTPFDAFGYSDERKLERQLIVDYEKLIREWLPRLQNVDYATVTELATLPESIRGFGHVKLAQIEQAKKRQQALMDKLGSSVKHEEEMA